MLKYLKSFIFVLILGNCWTGRAQSMDDFQSGANSSPTFKLSGDVALLSHYVEDGLSQTDKDPALQGSFWFNFGPQFRLGLWGSNVNYEVSDDHFNLRLKGDIKITFSPTANAILQYSQNQYYGSGDRNGNTLGLLVNFSRYRIHYEKKSNWEGTHDGATRYSLGLNSDIFNTWKWDNEVGYTSPESDSVSPYFDFRSGIGKKFGVIFFEGAVTATSSPSQFNGAGELFVILAASTQL